jgi:hypothetical protein
MIKETFLGKQVLIRTYSAGVHFGELHNTSDDLKVVHLKNTRRIWKWDGACSLSQIALEGVKNASDCKFSVEIPDNVLTETIEILPISETALTNLQNVPVWKR